MSSELSQRRIFIDGDDTLWKTQEIYDCVKLSFARLLDSSGIGVSQASLIDRLDEIDANRVSIRGFHPERFLESMLITYAECAGSYNKVWKVSVEKQIRDLANELYREPVLHEDTLPALESLRELAPLHLVTAGALTLQRNKVRSSGLEPYFAGIDIVPHKDETTFRQLLDRLKLAPEDTWMIGNSLRSDIVPSFRAGMRTIHVARGNWQYDNVPYGLSGNQSVIERLYEAESLADAAIALKQAITVDAKS